VSGIQEKEQIPVGEVMMGNTVYPSYIFGAKIPGRIHTVKGFPCQDAFSYEFFENSHVVIAVADGLGSASRSDTGAQCAVESAVNEVMSLLGQGETDTCLLLHAGIKKARQTLVQLAAREICPLRDFACTILLILASRDMLGTAHIGDGAIVVRASGENKIVSAPENSEYVNVVVPLTSNSWEEALRMRESFGPVECIAVFTDGLQNAALKKTGDLYEPFNAFFNPLFSYSLNVEDPECARKEIQNLLSSQKIQGSSDDDITLVIAVLHKEEGGQ